jgi:putative flippase GtrA
MAPTKGMKDKLKLLFTWRFIKFCVVGLSGVLVNLALLALLADVAGLHTNLAAVVAIEISINTNFLINEFWTFRDRRESGGGMGGRWGQFHLVSFGGAIIQLFVFVSCNVAFALLVDGPGALAHYLAQGDNWFEIYMVNPILRPPDVGHLKYLSQLIGIGVATFWNFFVNFFWTWRSHKEGS